MHIAEQIQHYVVYLRLYPGSFSIVKYLEKLKKKKLYRPTIHLDSVIKRHSLLATHEISRGDRMAAETDLCFEWSRVCRYMRNLLVWVSFKVQPRWDNPDKERPLPLLILFSHLSLCGSRKNTITSDAQLSCGCWFFRVTFHRLLLHVDINVLRRGGLLNFTHSVDYARNWV